MKKIYILFILCIGLYACQQEGTPIFSEGKSYLYFTDDFNKDSITYSFYFHPGEEKILAKLRLSAGGELLKEDLKLKFKIVEKYTTATPEDYSIPDGLIFPAGKEKDSVYIEIKKSAKLENQIIRLVLQLEETEGYTLGPNNHRHIKILFTSEKSKPLWWDKKARTYLGEYSHAKYEEFMSFTKVSDLSEKSYSEIYELALKFKYYLIERANSPDGPVMDGEQPMKVPVVG